MAYKVLIVDDQKIVRMLVESIIASTDRYQLVDSLASARSAAEICEDEEIDLVLMDVVLYDGYDGLTAAKEIKKVCPNTKIIIMTSMPEVSYLKKAREYGVESFWYKEVQEQPLLALMDRTMAGEEIYPDNTPMLILGNVTSEEFTNRELEVLREVVGGLTNQEIAEKLEISERTVKQHITHMLEKTGFANRVVLAVQARVQGLVINE